MHAEHAQASQEVRELPEPNNLVGGVSLREPYFKAPAAWRWVAGCGGGRRVQCYRRYPGALLQALDLSVRPVGIVAGSDAAAGIPQDEDPHIDNVPASPPRGNGR